MTQAAKKRRVHKTRTAGLYKVDRSRIFPDGGWKVRYRHNGGTREKTFRTKQEALDFQAAVRTDQRRGDFINPRMARTPFGVVAERWYEKKANDGETSGTPTPSTLAGYRVSLDAHLLPVFGERAIGSIKSSETEAFLTGSKAGWSVKTQRNLFRVLSPIFAMAARHEMIRVNPCERGRVELSKKKQSGTPAVTKDQVLTLRQIEELADEITSRYSLLVRFAAESGMRAGEIVALRVRHLDLLHGLVHVDESATEVGGTIMTGPPKNGKVREVYLSDAMVKLLREHVTDKGPEDFVFTAARGDQPRHGNFRNRPFRPAVRRLVESGRWPAQRLAGFRFHDLRHTCASELFRQGVHPKLVSEHLGHASVAITMDRYTHFQPKSHEPIVNALSATHESASRDEESTKVTQIR